MKKNYTKPSLLSETFITENIMTEPTSAINSLWSLSGEQFEGVKFNFNEGGNTLYRINFKDLK